MSTPPYTIKGDDAGKHTLPAIRSALVDLVHEVISLRSRWEGGILLDIGEMFGALGSRRKKRGQGLLGDREDGAYAPDAITCEGGQ